MKGLIYKPEQWAPLDIYPITPGKYMISDAGKILNKETNSLVPQHPNVKSGYYCSTLSIIDGGEKREFYIHRLVAQTFIPNTDNKSQVNHLDKKWLNDDMHLEWVTPQENTDHAMANGLVPIGEDRYNSIFTNEQVHQICKLLEQGYTRYGDILVALGITNNDKTRELVGTIKRGISWKHISSQYNIPTESFGNPVVYTEPEIHQICKYMADGLSNIDILKIMTGDPNAVVLAYRPQYDLICKVRKKKNYTYISDKYF